MNRKFEVDRVHACEDKGDGVYERCDNDNCSVEHLYSVYERVADGRALWLSDHADKKLADVAAEAYHSRAD